MQIALCATSLSSLRRTELQSTRKAELRAGARSGDARLEQRLVIEVAWISCGDRCDGATSRGSGSRSPACERLPDLVVAGTVRIALTAHDGHDTDVAECLERRYEPREAHVFAVSVHGADDPSRSPLGTCRPRRCKPNRSGRCRRFTSCRRSLGATVAATEPTRSSIGYVRRTDPAPADAGMRTAPGSRSRHC